MKENIIIIAALVIIIGVAILAIVVSRKSGKKCIGCPDSGCCSKAKNGGCCRCGEQK